jgi:hypothetical protein
MLATFPWPINRCAKLTIPQGTLRRGHLSLRRVTRSRGRGTLWVSIRGPAEDGCPAGPGLVIRHNPVPQPGQLGQTIASIGMPVNAGFPSSTTNLRNKPILCLHSAILAQTAQTSQRAAPTTPEVESSESTWRALQPSESLSLPQIQCNALMLSLLSLLSAAAPTSHFFPQAGPSETPPANSTSLSSQREVICLRGPGIGS